MHKKKIVWAGDSTVAQNSFATYPQTGIGQEFHRFLKTGVQVVNLAVNGRSTKSFIDEQRLVDAYFTLHEGDFFFIQFGHNDKKVEDPVRYAAPYGEYTDNLRKFINVARNRKATPVLISPILRIEVDSEGQLKNTHGEYPAAMEALAKEEGVLFVPLTDLSTAYVERKGVEACKRYFMHLEEGVFDAYPDGLHTDNTHLKYEGALLFGSLIADFLHNQGDLFHSILLDGQSSFHFTI